MGDVFKDFKFQIGDLVKHKTIPTDDDAFLVIDRELIQTTSGISKHYGVTMLDDYFQFDEIELSLLKTNTERHLS